MSARFRSFRTKSGLVFSCGDCVFCKLSEKEYPCNQCYKEIKDGNGRIPFITGTKFQHKDKEFEKTLVRLVKKHKSTISELYEELINNSISMDFFVSTLFEKTNQSYAEKYLKIKDEPLIKRKRLSSNKHN